MNVRRLDPATGQLRWPVPAPASSFTAGKAAQEPVRDAGARTDEVQALAFDAAARPGTRRAASQSAMLQLDCGDAVWLRGCTALRRYALGRAGRHSAVTWCTPSDAPARWGRCGQWSRAGFSGGRARAAEGRGRAPAAHRRPRP